MTGKRESQVYLQGALLRQGQHAGQAVRVDGLDLAPFPFGKGGVRGAVDDLVGTGQGPVQGLEMVR